VTESKKLDVFIIDPSLRSAAGHHLGILQAFRAELARLNLGSISLVSRFASADFARDADVVPTFEKSIYYRSAWTRAEFLEAADKFCADLRLALRKRRRRPDIFIFPAADQAIVAGFARYLKRSGLKRYGPRTAPEILLWLGMPPHFRKPIDDPSVAPLLAEYTEAFAALRQAVGDDDRIHVCSEEIDMTQAYAPRIGLPVETVFVPKLVQRPRSRAPRRAGDPIDIVCAGNANAAKGYALLPDAIASVNRQRADLRFFVHGTVEQTDDPEGWHALQRLAGFAPNVTVRTDVLSAEDYLAWLSRADFLLQPYDPVVYSTRGSGIFVEATKLGIPVIAPTACRFAQEAIEDGRAVGVEALTSDGVARALLAAADRIDEVTARAERFAASHGPDRRFRTLLTTAASSVAARKGHAPGRLAALWPFSLLQA